MRAQSYKHTRLFSSLECLDRQGVLVKIRSIQALEDCFARPWVHVTLSVCNGLGGVDLGKCLLFMLNAFAYTVCQ